MALQHADERPSTKATFAMPDVLMPDEFQYYRTFFLQATEGIARNELVMNAQDEVVDYRICEMNPAYMTLFDVPAGSAGQYASTLFGATQAPYLDTFTRVATTGEPTQFEMLDTRTNRTYTVAVLPAGGRQFFTVVNDITLTQQYEQTLWDMTTRYQRLYNSAQVGLYVMQLSDGCVIECNDQFVRMFGYTLREDLLTEFLLPLHTVEMNLYQQLLDRLTEEGALTDMQHRFIRRDGSIFWAQFSLIPSDEVGYIEGWLRDITAIKQVEEALQHSEERYRAIVEDQTDLIVRFLPNDEFTYLNDAFCRYYQLDAAKELGHQLSDALSPTDTLAIKQFLTTLTPDAPTGTLERERQFANLGVRCIHWTLRALFDTDECVIEYQAVGRDITESKQAERALAKLNDCFLHLGADANDNIQRWVALCGELLGADFALYTRLRDDRLCYVGRWNAPEGLLECPTLEGCLSWQVLQRNDNELIVVDDLSHSSFAETEPIILEHRLQTFLGQAVGCENQYVGVLCLYYHKAFIPGEEWRKLIGIVTSAIGVEEEHQLAETRRQQMEMQLRQAHHLESVGALAAGIAHEINTPTQFVGDNTNFLRDAFNDVQALLTAYETLQQACVSGTVTPDILQAVEDAAQQADMEYLQEEIPKAIEQSLDGIQRVSKIVLAMKQFSHPDSGEKSAVNINKAIESTVTVARNEWKYVAEMDLQLDPDLPTICCQGGEINQVLLNLIVNAAHAIGDVVNANGGGKGTITVSTGTVDGWVEIRVSDTGTGIPEGIRTRVFDPFFTTKEVGRGTGQGLAIAYNVIVKKHNGSIDFTTESGHGTTFIVRLPVTDDESEGMIG